MHPAYRSVVVMFCGPHDDGETIPKRRIDHAIDFARMSGSPLLIAGDANHGQDVSWFTRRALNAELPYVRAFYDRTGSTLTDARSIVQELLNNPPFMSVKDVHLVTDDWHMARAARILKGELRREMIHSRPAIRPVPVTTGPRPPEEILKGERQGLEDYLACRYGRRIAHPPYGKPASMAAS